MALIQTLTVSTIAFERKKEELYGFRQTDFNATDLVNHASKIINLMVRIRPTVSRSIRQPVRSLLYGIRKLDPYSMTLVSINYIIIWLIYVQEESANQLSRIPVHMGRTASYGPTFHHNKITTVVMFFIENKAVKNRRKM